MNLLKSYSLQSGQRIGKIQIQEKYFPLVCDKYIIFHCYSKPIKNYSYYNELIDILFPILEREGIKIVQIGQASDPKLKNTLSLNGLTSIPQACYLIKHAKLVLSCDSYSAHVAGHYDVPLVDIIVGNYKECVEPYFGDKSKQIVLEPARKEGEKPLFSYEDPNKSIDTIKPETIAIAVLKLLNIPFTPPYQSLYFGQSYNHQTIETVLNQKVHPGQFQANQMICRMDYLFDEKMLVEQLSICDNVLVSNKEISLSILESFKPKIKQLIYIVDKDNNPDFIKSVIKLGISVAMVSHLPEEELNKYKLNYVDLGIIHRKEVKTLDSVPELAGQKDLYFKTNRLILSAGKVYPSLYHLKHNIENSENNQVFDDYDFWKDLDLYFFYKKN